MDIHEQMDVKKAKKLLKDSQNVLSDASLDSFVSLQHVNKVYPNGAHAVYDFNLEVSGNEFVALVGPSGCGKSTTLRMIAGLEEISDGSLFIAQKYSNYTPSKDRDIAMVFQSYALYPQKTVYDNLAFGLKIRRLPREEIQKRVFEVAEILDLGAYLDRYSRELSGGQMQRVALGRAIVRKARLFLMDEPLSNLDAKLRVAMRSEIVRIHKEVGATTIYVTHDQTEAMTMADKIVVMNKGFIQQIGRPIDVYRYPENLFVATFIGSPSMNILAAEYDRGMVTFAQGEVSFQVKEEFQSAHDAFYQRRIRELTELLGNFDAFGESEIARFRASQIYVRADGFSPKAEKNSLLSRLFHHSRADQKEQERQKMKQTLEGMLKNAKTALGGKHPIMVGIRPEHFRYESERGPQTLEIVPELTELLGSEYIVHGQIWNARIAVKLDGSLGIESKSSVTVSMDLDKIHFFDGDSGVRIR